MTLKRSSGSGFYLDRATADALCRVKNADAIRLYLLAATRDGDEQAAARALGLNAETLREAVDALVAVGLAEAPTEQPKAVRQPLQGEPGYTAAEVTQLVTSDPAFAQIVREAEKVLQPCLNGSDLRELMTIYQYFGMPAECMILMIHFIARRSSKRNGKRASLAAVRREAMQWMELGIDTPEAAERYITEEDRIAETVERMEKAVGFQAYRSEDRRILHGWAEMGFDADAVTMAREITVKRIGEMQLKYAGSILRTWKEAGVTAAKDIVEYEAKRERDHETAKAAYEQRSGKKRVQSASGSFSSAEITAIRQIQELMNNREGENK